MAEVNVEAQAASPRTDLRSRPTGFGALSPLQAGLIYGGAASTVLGPLGLLVGAGAGILSKRLQKNFLDAETADIENTRAEYKGLTDEIESEMMIADPEEKRLLQHAQRVGTEGWYRLASGDESGRKMIEQANEISRGIMTADRDARKSEAAAQASVQRSLITGAAASYRDQFQQNLMLVEDVDKQATRVLDLVAQPGFDPNRPFNKAILAELLSTGIGGMYRDAPDVLDAVGQGAGSLGGIIGAIGGPAGAAIGQSAGDITNALITGVKAKDFKVTAEEYNRIAFNMRKFAQQYGASRMNRLAGQARDLDSFAKSVGAIPQDYSLGDYVSGGVKELKLAPTPRMPAVQKTTQDAARLEQIPKGMRAPPTESYLGPVNRQLRRLETWANKRRPTN